MRSLPLVLLALSLAACLPADPIERPGLAAQSLELSTRRLLIGPGEYRLIGSSGASIDWRICAPRVVRLAPDGVALGGTPLDPFAGFRLERGVGRELSAPSERRRVTVVLVVPTRTWSPDGALVGDGDGIAVLAPALARALVDTVDAASGGGVALTVRLAALDELILVDGPRGRGPDRGALDGLALGDGEIPLLLWSYRSEEALDLRSLAYAPESPGGPWISIAMAERVGSSIAALEAEYAERLARGGRLPNPHGRLRGFALAGTHELLHVLTALDGRPDLTDAASAGYRDDDHGPVSWAAWFAFRFAALDPDADLAVFPSPAEASVARDQGCPERRRADALGLRGE